MNSSPGLLERLSILLRSSDRALHTYLDWLEARFVEIEPTLQSFLLEPDRFERLHRQADELTQTHKHPEQRPLLFGLGVGVKDIFHVDGFETHAGSELPTDILTGDQAPSVTALRQAGALILGKTVTTEFAYFAPGPTHNPHLHDHTPGGSSSGSAAAVAAGLAPFALGTQTIGSVNRPAAFCGTVGFKPSHGRISTRGVIPLSPTFDHVGYFTPDAPSAAWIAPLLVEQWTGETTVDETLRLAIPVGPYLDQAEAAALEQFSVDCDLLRNAGHNILKIPVLDDFEAIVERHNIILAYDAARVHQAWFDAFAERYHPKTSELIRHGQSLTSEMVEDALLKKAELTVQLQQEMEEHAVDFWITPSAPGPALQSLERTGNPVMNLPWTQSGMPSLTIPTSKTPEGLPLAIQLVASVGQDERLLAGGELLDSSLNFTGIHGLDGFLQSEGAG